MLYASKASGKFQNNLNLFAKTILIVMIILALGGFFASPALASTTTVVKPSAMNGWGSYNDGFPGGTTNLVTGPVIAPMGSGSLQFTLNSTARMLMGTPAYAGTRLDQITNLQYSTYRNSVDAGDLLAVTLQFDMDYDLNDATTTWQSRLVFEPYFTAGSGNIPQNTWQTWTPLSGQWWISGTPIVGDIAVTNPCPQASPCTWGAVLSAFPNAGLRAGIGLLWFKAGGPWASFDGNVDAFTIGISGNDTIYDFEPEISCTTVCYADAVNGNDAFGGDSPTSAKKTIQAAIDAVSPGGQVRVLPGNYSEAAANRFVLGSLNGPHQFGLFISQDKDGISIIGVNSSDIPVTNYNSLLAHVETNATNNFGPSGIFVEGDNVTIAGLDILDNVTGNNKTIEIIGDNFTLEHSHINVSDGGSVYFNDWQFDTVNNVSHVKSYTLNHNWIDLSASVDLTSGAGLSGPVAGRQITNNKFVADGYWPSISFSGSDTGVPWFVYSVGGAVITGNDFTNTSNTADETSAHIRARGTYDNTQFDWTSYWNDNTFNKATVTLVGTFPAFDVRTYSYPGGYGTYNNVRRIGVTIQGEVNHAVASDTVLVNQGTYVEQVAIPKTLHLFGEDGALLTFIKAPATIPVASDPDSNIVKIAGTGVSVEMNGFTVTGPGPSGCGSIARGIFVRDDAYANIHNNRVLDVRDNPFSGCQNGIGIQVGSSSIGTSGTADITNNILINYQKGGIVIANAGSNATITGNTVTGAGPTTVTAQNGIQVGVGATADVINNTVSGHSYTPFSYVATGMLLYGPGEINTSGNTVSENQVGIYVVEAPGGHDGNIVIASGAGTGSLGFWGIIVDAPPPAHVPSPFEVVQDEEQPANSIQAFSLLAASVQQVTVTNNVLTGDGTAAGIGLEADSGYGASDIDLTATNNFIQNWGVAVEIYECSGSCTGTTFSNLNVNLNSLTGNLIGYDHSNATFIANGEKNWWGSASGPSVVGPGSGDSVSADVDFDPWLCDGTDTSASIGFQPNLVTSPCVGNLAVTKIVNWNSVTPDNAQTFEICIAGPSYPLGNEAGACQTTDFDGGVLTWSNVQSGSYTVSETNPGALWSTTISGSPTIVSIGQTATATVTNNRAKPKIAIDKNGPVTADGGGPVPYTYLVTNPGNVPLSNVSVVDNKCSPVLYQSGDDGDLLLENGETWTYNCTYTPAFSSYYYLKNTATASGKFNTQTVTATDDFKLYPFTLQKKIYLYWDGHHNNIAYSQTDNTAFSVEVYKNNVLVGTVTIAQNAPKKLWLSSGNYKFKEVNLPFGYLASNSVISYTTGYSNSSATFANIITADLNIDKTGPATARKGQTVTYNYKVTNAGPASVVPLVTDNKCSPVTYVSGDTDHDGRLDPGETWLYQCKYKVRSNPGTVIVNIATVSGYQRPDRCDGGDRNIYNDTDKWSMKIVP